MRISDWSSDVCSSDLELAFARVLAREGSDLADPMELSALDYARTILVDVSIQREAEAELQIMDILDRRDQYSWLSSEHQGKPWHSAEIAPSEFLNFAADELAVVARSEERRVGKECVRTGRSWCEHAK